MRSVLPRAEEAPRVASALATLEEIEKVAAENKSWEDLSIVDKSVMEDLRDRVSFHEFLLLSVILAPFLFAPKDQEQNLHLNCRARKERSFKVSSAKAERGDDSHIIASPVSSSYSNRTTG